MKHRKIRNNTLFTADADPGPDVICPSNTLLGGKKREMKE